MTLNERIAALDHREARVALAILAACSNQGAVERSLNMARRHVDMYPDPESEA